jgi:thiamine-monophosphate kinase
VDEFEIIRRFFERASSDDSVLIGVGDDGAVVRPEAGLDLVTVLDTLVAGVHYPESLPPADIGYRAVAVNLSDIAAMGGRPRWMTLGLTMHNADADWLEQFSSGLYDAARAYDVRLVGGDLTYGSEVVMSVQINGDIEPGRALRRDGARPGDGIYVSGTPGDAGAGLALLQQDTAAAEGRDYLVRRFSRPTPRIALGQSLSGVASAAIDLSDGLYSDLSKLLDASGAGGCIELDDCPLSAGILQVMGRRDAIGFALAGGDDYELCFTAADLGDAAEVGGVAVTRIGAVTDGRGLSCTQAGVPYDYQDGGYRHFR